MKLSRLAALSLSLSLSLAAASLAACDKHNQREAAARPAVATSKPSALVTRVAEPAAEPATCGDADMKEGTCGGGGEGCAQWDEAAAAVARRGTPADAEWKTIAVKGMSCGGCERRIIADLGKLDGVLGVEADAELGEVRVAFARGRDAIAADARARIATLGYRPQ